MMSDDILNKVKVEFNNSTFYGKLCEIEVYKKQYYYGIYVSVIIEFLTKSISHHRVVKFNKFYHEQELQNPKIRTLIINEIDYKLYEEIKKLKIDMFQKCEDIISIKLYCNSI